MEVEATFQSFNAARKDISEEINGGRRRMEEFEGQWRRRERKGGVISVRNGGRNR